VSGACRRDIGEHPLPNTEINSTADLIQLVEEHRVARGLSLRALCDQAHVSHSGYWYTMERGGDVKLSTALNYLGALGLRMQVQAGGLD